MSTQEMLDIAARHDTQMALAMMRACAQRSIVLLEPLRYPDREMPAPRYPWDPIEVVVDDAEYERIASLGRRVECD